MSGYESIDRASQPGYAELMAFPGGARNWHARRRHYMKQTVTEFLVEQVAKSYADEAEGEDLVALAEGVFGLGC